MSLKYRFAARRRTAAEWIALNEVLLNSEIGRESDTGKIKFGDGVTGWNSLPYFASGSGGGTWGTITGTLSDQLDLQAALDALQTTANNGITKTGSNFRLGGTLDAVTDIDIANFGYKWSFSTVDATVTNTGSEWFSNASGIDAGYIEKYIFGQSAKANGDFSNWFFDFFTTNDGEPGAWCDFGINELVGTVLKFAEVKTTAQGAELNYEYLDSANPGNNHSAAVRVVADASGATVALTGDAAISGDIQAANLSGTNTGDQDLSSYATTAAVAAGFQPLDSDLTAIAALSTTAYGRALLTLADAAAGRTAFGLGSAATQPSAAFDAAGAAAAAQAASQPLDADLTAIAALTTTVYGRGFLALADAAAARTALSLGTLATQNGTFSGTSSGTNTGDQTSIVGITGSLAEFNAALTGADFATGGGTATGTNTGDQDLSSYATTAAVAAGYQPLDSDLTAIAALSTTSYGRAFLALADAAAARTALALGTLATQNGTFSGTSSGTNTGDQTSVSGNAGTATTLATSRNIDGQAFNGSADITVIAPGTHAATSKATPVDADELPLVDSAAANILKKLTWANLKAAFINTAHSWTAQQTWAACTASIASFVMSAGTLMTTAAVGAWEFAGGVFYSSTSAGSRGVVPSWQIVSNGAVVALSNSSTSAQNVFPSANDVLTLAANTTYFVEANFIVTTGGTSHTTLWSLGGTATFTSIGINQMSAAGSLGAANAVQSVWVSSAGGTAVAGTTNTAIKTYWTGIIRTNAAGTIIPQVTFSAGPTGTCQIEPNSFLRMTPIGSDTFAAVGNWA